MALTTNPYACERREKAPPGESEIRDGPFARAIDSVLDRLDGALGAVAKVVGFVFGLVLFPFDLILRVASAVGVPLVFGLQLLFPLVSPIADMVALDPVVIACAVLLVLIRVGLLPLAYAGARQAVKMQAAAPHIRRLQQQYAHDKDELNRAIVALYRETKLNPLGCVGPLLPALLLIVAFYGAVELLVTRSRAGTFDPRHVAESSQLAEHMRSLEFFTSWSMDLTLSSSQAGTCAKALPYIAVLVVLLVATAYSASAFAVSTAPSKVVMVGVVTGATFVFAVALPAIVVMLRVVDALYLLLQHEILKRYRRSYADQLAHDPNFQRWMAETYADVGSLLRRD